MPDFEFTESADDATTYDGMDFGETSTLGVEESYPDDTTTYDGMDFGETSTPEVEEPVADDTTTYW